MMTRRYILAALAAMVLAAAASLAVRHVARAQDTAPDASQPREFGELSRAAEVRSPFRVLDVYVDSGASALAAYQFEFNTAQKDAGELKLVGIEGGEPPAFREPPRYDPRAL